MELRCLHLVGATGRIRTAQFNGTEHLVVPIVAMVEGVVHAVNSKHPELVTAEELAITPQQWNGRPCFAGHPKVGSAQVTANTPEILEQSFGTVFHTAPAERILQARRLEFEAYIDPQRAEKVGPEAASVVTRLKAGETVEVSVGAFITATSKEGEFGGKKYKGQWTEIVSDHLAFLKKNETGACSVSAGCGAARAAIRHLITAEGIQQEDEYMAEEPKRPSIRERLSAMIATLRDSGETSDTDVRKALDGALRAVEPGYMGICEVYPGDSQVIYYVAPKDVWQYRRRGYSMAADGLATLADDAEDVKMTTVYEPMVTAALEAPTPCGCANTPAPAPIVSLHNGDSSMTPETKTMIDASQGRFTEADATWLEQIPADRLAALTAVAPVAPVAPVVEPTVASAKPPTEAEWLAAAPASLRALIERQQAADLAIHNTLVATLKTAQSAYTESELQAMPNEQLTRLAAVAKVQPADYSGLGVATPRTEPSTMPPDPWASALKRVQ